MATCKNCGKTIDDKVYLYKMPGGSEGCLYCAFKCPECKGYFYAIESDFLDSFGRPVDVTCAAKLAEPTR